MTIITLIVILAVCVICIYIYNSVQAAAGLECSRRRSAAHHNIRCEPVTKKV